MQLASIALFFSILVPSRMWYAPNQPLLVTAKTDAAVTLVMTDFTGRVLEPKAPADVAGGKEVDLKEIFPLVVAPGTYVVYAVPKGKKAAEFLGTPIVITVRADKRAGAAEGTLVTKVEPLRYVVMTTDQGPMTMVFYYDVAPNTVNSFLTLCEQGFYDNLTFHRIIPGFVVQGGDPHGDGMGGPGFHIEAEFSDRKHEEGVLSMARNGDPLEPQGMRPRPEFANSAGSQFFVCLSKKEFLDGRYTAFGKVVEGMDSVKKLAQTPLADAKSGRPTTPPVIKKAEVKMVTANNNPYTILLNPPVVTEEKK